MKNQELIDTIRNEIERRKKSLRAGICNPDAFTRKQKLEMLVASEELDRFNRFLSDLEKSEKPMNPEDAMKELDEKIALVKQRGTWDGVDVDKYMDEVRGREPEKPVPNDLEEAAKEYTDGKSWAKENYLTPYIREAFIAGAKWQAEQLLKSSPPPEDTVLFQKGVEEGERLMMEEAVGGGVYGKTKTRKK